MKRRIFVGSSAESIDKARQICDVLLGVEETESVLWNTQFQPGYLTFESLEEMMHQCCAAVFVATPDDDSVIRGKPGKSPRGNILLEFGLVAGRMGRHNIALCRYGGAELPSDLKGLTVIEMDPPDDSGDKQLFLQRAGDELRIWSSRLIATPDTIARTEIFHGYTGRWDFQLNLTKWRDLPIHRPSYAQVNGYLNLIISASGHAGGGLAHGRLFFKLIQAEDGGVFQGEIRTSHEIRDAFCHRNGAIEFVTQAFVQNKVTLNGKPPLELDGVDVAPEPWSSRWQLHPSSEPRSLEGSVCTESEGLTEGTVKLTKSSGGV